MKIRQIKKTDEKNIYELALEEDKLMKKFYSFKIYERSLTKKSFKKLFSRYLKKDRFFYGIEQNKKIIAFLMGSIKKVLNGKVGYIDDIMVSKSSKGKGFSTQLRNIFFKWLKKKNITYCQLHLLDKNKDAFNIYKKWGFKVDGMQMTKRLK